MSNLQDNLNRISQKLNKHVLICEISYGFTLEDTSYARIKTENIDVHILSVVKKNKL